MDLIYIELFVRKEVCQLLINLKQELMSIILLSIWSLKIIKEFGENTSNQCRNLT